MIFVSFGNPYHSFDRLAIAIDKFAFESGEEVIVQTGHTKFDYKYAVSFDFCLQDEMKDYILRAEILVLQGGWGSISDAIDLGKKLVVVPRINGIEHNHDQEQLVRKLESIGCLLGVYDINTLPSIINNAKEFNFKSLKRGNPTNIIQKSIDEWFPQFKKVNV